MLCHFIEGRVKVFLVAESHDLATLFEQTYQFVKVFPIKLQWRQKLYLWTLAFDHIFSKL